MLSSFLTSRAAAARVAPTFLRGFASSSDITRVGVVGLGLMGHGIAQVAAEKGFEVYALETTDGALQRGIGMIENSLETIAKRGVKKGQFSEAEGKKFVEDVRGRIVSTSTDLSSLKDCDIVVEAIIENLDVKKGLYKTMGGVINPNAIFASNTSSFEIGLMSEDSGRPDRLVGLHFFNPVQIMKLVEVIKTEHTSEEVFERALQFGRDLGKEAVACKDTPGFIVNRLLVPYIVQAILMVERGDASLNDVDTAMVHGCGYPMGPFTLCDYVGLDTILFVMEGWVKRYPNEPTFVVPQTLKRMVDEGKLGRKTGQGFFKWEGNKKV